MKRCVGITVAVAACLLCGCAFWHSGGIGGVSKTICEVWINSMPQGALLYLNGHYVGRTPYKYTVINEGDASAHFIARDLSEITCRKRGFDDEVEMITVENCYKKFSIQNEGVTEQVKRYKGFIALYLDVKEDFAEKEFGNLVITCNPQAADAEIYINDSLIGNGKTSLLKLPAGSYILRIRKAGYKLYSRVISVLADNDLTITANLERTDAGANEPAPAMTPEVESSPPGRDVELEEDYTPGSAEVEE
ncbi:MAG: PEGA domain-containing protein [Candidatus Aureabacteria bacterium]|nr:PEGA domain-containing protein [Candidatus Auribacterota bacterium]